MLHVITKQTLALKENRRHLCIECVWTYHSSWASRRQQWCQIWGLAQVQTQPSHHLVLGHSADRFRGLPFQATHNMAMEHNLRRNNSGHVKSQGVWIFSANHDFIQKDFVWNVMFCQVFSEILVCSDLHFPYCVCMLMIFANCSKE